MQGKVCLVTGANRGIGKEIARGLARAGWTVMVHSRTAEKAAATVAELKAETGNEKIRGFHADFLVQSEVRRLAAEVIATTDRLHLLVNNAGTFNLYRTSAPDGHEATFTVNHLGPFILTRALKELLKASAPSRVVNVASEAHQRVTNVEDWESAKGYTGYQAYARSKVANVMFT
ncbi:MAG TPA: SDR family NAD(P)-dependent oxidoreductase, partial [Gemmatimonadales bacterium]|nr:SDR family NAD(P)-dependent oxidoreductase [Gemmatimonadales bacterium]